MALNPGWYPYFNNSVWQGVAGTSGQSAAVWNTDHWTVYYKTGKALSYVTELNDSLLLLRPTHFRLTFTGAYTWIKITLYSDDNTVLVNNQTVYSGTSYAISYTGNKRDIARMTFIGNSLNTSEQSWEITDIEFYDNGDRQVSQSILNAEADAGYGDYIPSGGGPYFYGDPGDSIYLGWCWGAEEAFLSFRNLPIYSEYAINAAKLYLKCSSTPSAEGNINFAIKVHGNSNEPYPTTAEEYVAKRAGCLSSPKVDWDFTMNAAYWTGTKELDVTPLVQSAVRLSGWTLGTADGGLLTTFNNRLLLFIVNDGTDLGETCPDGTIDDCWPTLTPAEITIDYNIVETWNYYRMVSGIGLGTAYPVKDRGGSITARDVKILQALGEERLKDYISHSEIDIGTRAILPFAMKNSLGTYRDLRFKTHSRISEELFLQIPVLERENETFYHKLKVSDGSGGDYQAFPVKLRNSLSETSSPLKAWETIYEGNSYRVKALNELSSGDVEFPVSARDEIVATDRAAFFLAVLGQIGEPEPVIIPTTPMTSSDPYDIFINGKLCNTRIGSCSISYGEGYVHNSIEISSSDWDLFNEINPAGHETDERIRVEIGTRVMRFTIDDRKVNSENDFSISGYSLSVRNNAEFNQTWEIPDIEGQVNAHSLCDSLLTYGETIWQIPDWHLPEDPDLPDDPVECVKRIAETIKAVVRSHDDGRLIVRRRWPMSPREMKTVAPQITYEIENIIAPSISSSIEKGTGYNAIEVGNSDGDSDTLPDIELQEESPEIGDTVHLRVFWQGGEPPEEVETYLTAGEITDLGIQTTGYPMWDPEEKEVKAERIEFKEGKASVSHPITEITSMAWIGKVPGNGEVTFTPYTKELTLADGLWGIAELFYTSTYSIYRVSEHYIYALMAVFGFYGNYSGINVYVTTGEEPVIEADPVSDVFITNEMIAVERGKAELYELRYDKAVIAFSAPYEEGCVDGAIIYVNHPKVDIVGTYIVTKADIEFNGPAILNHIEAKKLLNVSG